MNNKIIIAIDGYSGCGKTTLSKDLAKATGFLYIDTGAMYRGVTLFAIENGLINKNNEIDVPRLVASLDVIELSFIHDPQQNIRRLMLNEQEVEEKIRSPEVSNLVAKVAQIKEVRQKLIAQQQKMSESIDVILDGRDIGSAVFPQADLKLFITADVSIRTQRRWNELKEKGVDISYQEVHDNLLERDEIDRNRTENPLVQVHDAIVIDTGKFTREGQLAYVLSLLKQRESNSRK